MIHNSSDKFIPCTLSTAFIYIATLFLKPLNGQGWEVDTSCRQQLLNLGYNMSKGMNDKAVVQFFVFLETHSRQPNPQFEKHLHVAATTAFSSISAVIPTLSCLLFIQTCEFLLFLSGGPLIPQADWGWVGGGSVGVVRGKLGRVTPVALDVLYEPG